MEKPFAKSKILALRAIATLFTLTAAVILFIIIKQWYENTQYNGYLHDDHNTIFDWWHWVVPVFAAVTLLSVARNRERYWYHEGVGMGKVVNHTYSRNGYGSLYYYLVVNGHNRAGEQGNYYIEVDPRTYNRSEVGDRYDMGA